jgi:hypothetical protein
LQKLIMLTHTNLPLLIQDDCAKNVNL